MAAQQRINQLTGNLDAFSDLIDIVKDPKAFAASEKQIRAELALTQTEIDKAEVAHELIVQADSMQIRIQAAQNSLETQREKFNEEKETFEAYKASELARLENFSADLDKKQITINDLQAGLAATQKDLEDGQKRVAEQIKSEQIRIDADKAVNEKNATNNAQEKENLAIIKSDLDVRAQKITLREQAAAL